MVQYIHAELKCANVVLTQLLILPASDTSLMYTNMLTLTQGQEVHYFEKFLGKLLYMFLFLI